MPRSTYSPDEVPKVRKDGKAPRTGRPRKDGKPPRVSNKPLPLQVRREIKRMLDDGATMAQIQLRYKRYKPTVSQIQAIKYGQVKLVATPRSDSHRSEIGADSPIRKSNDAIALIREGLVDALNALQVRTRMTPEDRIETLKDASLINQRVTRASLVNAMGRRDADIILEIIRMYEPNATEENAIAIYRQAADIVSRRDSDN